MEKKNPVVSVVIPCRNHAAALSRCLDSVMSQQLAEGFEVIVVDAAADDRVATVVSEHVPAYIVRSTLPLLPGPARNLGARTALGIYAAFIDADCVAEAGWLAAALLALKEGARVVGGAVGQGSPWHPVASIDNLMQFSDLSGRRGRGNAHLLPSCNLGIALSDFMALGGFPAVDLPAGEDVLFCQLASERWPNQMLFCPTMRVRHFGRSTLRQLWAHQHMFGFARAMYGLQLRPVYRRLGQWSIMAPAVALRRLTYMAVRAARWQPASLAAMILYLPVLLFGMTAWCMGFHRGCRRWGAT
jgi:glycosyltransferase involved in cell wall biosynthesis